MSLSLLILQTEIVTVMAVIDLHFAGSRDRESLGRSLMCFDFSHDIYFLS